MNSLHIDQPLQPPARYETSLGRTPPQCTGWPVAEHTVVAIPARDEAERIEACLNALNRQVLRPDSVVLILNNCTDATQAITRRMAPDLRFRLDVIIRDLPPARANAGHARRLAMEVAGEQAGAHGILLTTDADSVVPPDWVFRNVEALRRGAEVVCGRAVVDPHEAALIPAHLQDDDVQECRLIGLLDDLAWVLDPEMHDPPPRHTEASGASLAVSVAAFRKVGGIPDVSSGEDRAFVRALWMIDARVRHDPAIRVTVSGRVVGRAKGGMADTIRRRMVRQDEFTDDQAELAADAFRRYRLRQRIRRAWKSAPDPALEADLGLSREVISEALAHRFFGRAWADLEIVSPILQRRRVRFSDLSAEIEAAQALLEQFAKPNILAAE